MNIRLKTFAPAFAALAIAGTTQAATLYAIPTFLNGTPLATETERFITEYVTVNVAAGVSGYSAVDIDENQTVQAPNTTLPNASPRFGNYLRSSSTGNVVGGQKLGYVILSADDDDYIEFSISAADPGTELDLTSLTFDVVRGSDSSVRSYDIDVSIDGGAFSDLASSTITATKDDATPDNAVIDLSGAAYQGVDTFTIRVFESGGTILLSNLAISGEVVPEPGSLALLGLGGLCLIKRRRKA